MLLGSQGARHPVISPSSSHGRETGPRQVSVSTSHLPRERPSASARAGCSSQPLRLLRPRPHQRRHWPRWPHWGAGIASEHDTGCPSPAHPSSFRQRLGCRCSVPLWWRSPVTPRPVCPDAACRPPPAGSQFPCQQGSLDRDVATPSVAAGWPVTRGSRPHAAWPLTFLFPAPHPLLQPQRTEPAQSCALP